MEKRNGVIRITMKQILLYSGGLDSAAAAFLHPKASLVYVNYHGKYCDKEQSYLFEAASLLRREVHLIHKTLDLSDLESGEGAFLPNRNAFLILTAINIVCNPIYGDETDFEIILNATASGIHTDKDEIFASKMSDLLNYMNRGGADSPAKTYKIVLPTKHLTKIQIVSQFFVFCGVPEILNKSVSCYDKHKRQCGECRSCCRKFVALKANEIICDFTPTKEALSKMRQRCLDQTWCSSEVEMEESLKVLECVL